MMTDDVRVPPIDYNSLFEERCRGKADLAARLLRNLLEDSGPRWMVEAEEVAKSGDFISLARIGHSIKGSCKILFAQAMVSAAVRLENAAKEGAMEEVMQALEELKSVFHETSEWLRNNSHLLD